tara:strand:+ start:3875 stop:4675 length:801 start_codon:yes stop_codon:yes gene_type:complete
MFKKFIKFKILDFLNIILQNYQYGVFKSTSYKKIKRLVDSLKINDLGYNLIRVGPKGDGGYLIPDILDEIDECYSAGVGEIHGFEEDLFKKNIKIFMADNTVNKPNILGGDFSYIKKNLATYDDNDHTTIGSWMKNSENENLILQMDIEGSEYEIINSITETNLKRFKIMVIEFHHFEQIITKLGYTMVSSVINKINKYFDVSHIHPNNSSIVHKISGIKIPSTLEITFLNKENSKYKKKINKIPHEFDYKNKNKYPEIILSDSWY